MTSVLLQTRLCPQSTGNTFFHALIRCNTRSGCACEAALRTGTISVVLAQCFFLSDCPAIHTAVPIHALLPLSMMPSAKFDGHACLLL